MKSNDSIYRLNFVTERVGLSKATVYKMIKAGLFPAPKQLGLRSVGWLESDITAWIESRTSTNA
jgi:prophage regulatory protein